MKSLFAFLLLLPLGCAQEEGATIPLPVGEYSVLGPLCASTQQSPVYPTAEQALALFDFSGVISHKMFRNPYLNSPFVLEEIQTTSCKLSIRKSALVPIEGYFGTGAMKDFTWEPEGCELVIDTISETVLINRKSSAIFDKKNTPEADILYEVTMNNGQYILRSAKGEPYSSAWFKFGCAESDQIQYNLSPI